MNLVFYHRKIYIYFICEASSSMPSLTPAAATFFTSTLSKEEFLDFAVQIKITKGSKSGEYAGVRHSFQSPLFQDINDKRLNNMRKQKKTSPQDNRQPRPLLSETNRFSSAAQLTFVWCSLLSSPRDEISLPHNHNKPLPDRWQVMASENCWASDLWLKVMFRSESKICIEVCHLRWHCCLYGAQSINWAMSDRRA